MHQLLKLTEVIARTKRSKAAIYRDVRRGTFPRPRKVGASSLWVGSEIDGWISNVVGSSREGA